jgi:hypothetical protein
MIGGWSHSVMAVRRSVSFIGISTVLVSELELQGYPDQCGVRKPNLGTSERVDKLLTEHLRSDALVVRFQGALVDFDQGTSMSFQETARLLPREHSEVPKLLY